MTASAIDNELHQSKAAQMTLTIDQQRDDLRRRQIGWEAATRDQNDRVRAMSEVDRWDEADELMADWAHMRIASTVTSGLVEQQRLFAKLRQP